MDYQPSVFFAYLFDQRIAMGALMTVLVAIAAQILATLLGFLVALGLIGRRPYAVAAQLYLWAFRGVPPLVLLLMLYFGLPELGVRLPVLTAGIVGLSLYGSGYMAEIFRSGLQSIDQGQMEAARSLGYSYAQSMRLVLLPQAIRIVLPPFGNEFTSMMRTTSLLSAISFEELLRATTLAINETFRPLELYSVAAVYYVVMTSAWLVLQRPLENFFARGQRRSGGALAGAGSS